MYQQSPVSATNLVTSLNQKINYGLNDLWQRQEAVRSTISYRMSHDSKIFRKIDNISVNKFPRLFAVGWSAGRLGFFYEGLDKRKVLPWLSRFLSILQQPPLML
ncbi:hypothetical protein RO3G_06436 [Rhizopus delemar RA 99-880]|uniref:Uncharacterized protein n=1 Tax=Rhizopus delemar (strain RA 99-880 / ATCC MYA-4621 / FGSC 9543 / NRRL 43880) TaxID=246409 RepID=I1BZV1_RHIO9|nr:hypothetical protein RO3G_06436 [Rhizopus delemar RA 99-880]|eukprot:EIE81731.1 hypothetical protein RO3G_06436 [Rhizopus delemar RA 99-880]